MTLGQEEVGPGTRDVINQTEYVAVSIDHLGSQSLGCEYCAFTAHGAGTSHECRTINCRGVVWMTPIKLITLRITK